MKVVVYRQSTWHWYFLIVSLLMTVKRWALVDRASIIGPCVQYGNSREIYSALSNVMYYNRVKDDIHVNADGVGDETGTKVDIDLSMVRKALR